MEMNMRKKVKVVFRSALAVLLAIVIVLPSALPTTQVVAAEKTSKTVATKAVEKTSETAATKAAEKTSITVSTQAKLTKALADKSIQTIIIKTSSAQNFIVPNKAYKTKTLVINAAKASVVNGGTFKDIVITDANSITESAKGNNITVNDKKVTIKVTKSAEVKTVTVAKKDAKCNIVINGDISKLVLSKKAEVAITGNISSIIPVQIKALAKGALITSAVPVEVTAAADASISLHEGAEGSTVTLVDKEMNIKVENKTTKTVEITTPDGKETVEAGKTASFQNEPTETPEATQTPSSSGTSNTRYYTVNFDSNGGTSIVSDRVAGGGIINNLPTPQKNNSIFLGWYTDSGHQNKFSEDYAVNSDLTLYAKYSEIETEQQSLNDTYTLTEQESGLSFTVISTDESMTADSVKAALELSVADGSETLGLAVTGSNGNFIVTAQNGFAEGASYTLTLSDNKLSFKDKETTIRKCSFTIAKKEVYNIEMNNGIVYIPESTLANITKNGTSVESLSIAVVNLTNSGSNDTSTSGTFNYSGNVVLKTSDVLCVYSGDKPEAPTGNENDAGYMNDDIAYIKVTTVTGSIGSQSVSYSNADAEEVLFTPDVLPIAVGDVNYTAADANAAGSFTEVQSELNFSTYSDMGLSDETTIDVGDYLAFYTGTYNDTSNTSPVVYGKVTGVTEQDGNVTVTFTATTEDEMKEILDYYSKNDVDSNALLEDVDVAALEDNIEQQVQASGFAEDASVYMTALALKTDGFHKIAGNDLESFSIDMADGTSTGLYKIESMSKCSTSSTPSISNLKVKANIGKNLQKLSGNGVRCAVTVSFDVPIEAGDGSEIVIALSATFVEEIKLSIDASGKAVWKKKWIFPYIADYQMNANIDVYDYTGIKFQAIVTSQADTETIDISKEIQNIMSYTDSEQISSGVQELFEIYGNMMENESDWIDIFSQNISKTEQSLLLGVIQIKTTVDFVVSANINVALGCNFDYKSGTRYCFWAKVKAKDGGSDTIDLMDEQYSFQLYVMGSLGLRAGIRLEFAVGLFSVDLNSIGLTAEAGVYAKLYGYFFYQLDSVNSLKSSKMSGALYVDFGIYLEIAFKAQVLDGKFQYNPTLYENEWPLLSVGTRYNVYNFSYDKPSSTIKMKDTVKSYTLPDSTFNMTYLDLKKGDISTKTYKNTDFNIDFSNSNFSLNGNTVKVNVPLETHKLECDMTVTWKSTALAFSSVSMARTFHLVWDDLNDKGYTISYNSNGGSMVSSITQLYGTTVTTPTAPQKTGYTFSGWYSNENLTTQYTFSTMPANNVVLYAKWTANTSTQYKVEYYQQNLENDNYTQYASEVLTGTTGTTASAAAKSYTGFTYNSSAKDTITTSSIAADGSLVLKQFYDRNSYTLTFKPENGGSDMVKAVKYGAVISAPTVVKTGYTFKGWDNTIAGTMPAANTTYTAQWVPNTVSDVRLEGENGVLYGGASIEYTSGASNGMHVGYIDWDGAGVSFENLNASNSIILCYAGMMSGTESIYVNGVKVGTISLTSTGTYQTYGIVKIEGLNLKNGDTLSFQYDSGNTAFNIDYIAYNISGTVTSVTVQN